MMNTVELFQKAQDSNIPVMYLYIPESGSMCLQSESRQCYIGMDYDVLKSEADNRVHLAHELGHCMTGSFYNIYSPCDVRGRHEYRADKWAVHSLMPMAELEQALDDGCIEVWNLAERFGVTEDFVKRAAYIYQCEGELPA